MDRVKVLAVAPYEEMRDIIESIAAARDDIDVTTVVGNMERGAELVCGLDQSEYDVIISRGGTAQCVKDVAGLPVIEIELTPYDIQNALSSIIGTNKKFAVVGYNGIADAAGTLCDILNIDVQIVNIHGTSESFSILKKLRSEGVEIIICDATGEAAARELGMASVLITSGVKGIEDALNKAASYFSSMNRSKLGLNIYEAAVAAFGESVVVLNGSAQIIFASPKQTVQPSMRGLLSRLVPAVFANDHVSAVRPIGNTEYEIEGRKITYSNEQFAFFKIKAGGPRLPVNVSGVSFYNSSEEDMNTIGLYYGGHCIGIRERAKRLAMSGLPLLVYGERGTYVEAMAGYICMHGLLSEHECIVIDCAEVTAKGWAKLLGDSGLIMFRPGSTVLFGNVLRLSDDNIRQIVEFLDESNLSHQLRIVFSMVTGEYPKRENDIIRLISSKLFGAALSLPPLRERRAELPDIIDVCFTSVCALQGIKKPMLEPEAEKLLEDFLWSKNLPQLRKVLTQLAAASEGGVISAKETADALDCEASVSSAPTENSNIDLSGTLEEISGRVVRHVLAEERMNRSRTAKRLGISRATLWRILGKEED